MEALSLLLDKAVVGGYLSRYSFKGRNGTGEVISHLLFADDTLIFCKDLEDQMVHLAWFEAISGLKINLEKSCLIPIGRVFLGPELATELGC